MQRANRELPSSLERRTINHVYMVMLQSRCGIATSLRKEESQMHGYNAWQIYALDEQAG
jgi:hypothetical protein